MENQVLKAIEERCSTRFYLNEKLSEKEVMTLVKAGLQAPTARNTKELLFTVVEGTNPVMAEVDEAIWASRNMKKPIKNFYYDAPIIIHISASDNIGWEGVDAGIAAENIAIAAEGMGLGSLIIGMNKMVLCGEKSAYFKEKLQIPADFTYQVCVAVGRKEKGKVPHDYDFDSQVKFI